MASSIASSGRSSVVASNLIVKNCERHSIVNGEYAEEFRRDNRSIYKHISAEVSLFYNPKSSYWIFAEDIYDSESYFYFLQNNSYNPTDQNGPWYYTASNGKSKPEEITISEKRRRVSKNITGNLERGEKSSRKNYEDEYTTAGSQRGTTKSKKRDKKEKQKKSQKEADDEFQRKKQKNLDDYDNGNVGNSQKQKDVAFERKKQKDLDDFDNGNGMKLSEDSDMAMIMDYTTKYQDLKDKTSKKAKELTDIQYSINTADAEMNRASKELSSLRSAQNKTFSKKLELGESLEKLQEETDKIKSNGEREAQQKTMDSKKENIEHLKSNLENKRELNLLYNKTPRPSDQQEATKTECDNLNKGIKKVNLEIKKLEIKKTKLAEQLENTADDVADDSPDDVAIPGVGPCLKCNKLYNSDATLHHKDCGHFTCGDCSTPRNKCPAGCDKYSLTSMLTLRPIDVE